MEGLDWIRLHYAYPSKFPMDALEVMREKKNICNYLDIPIQHITDQVLKTMRRAEDSVEIVLATVLPAAPSVPPAPVTVVSSAVV